jgi:hypothetical protein
MGQDLVGRNWQRIDETGIGEAELVQDCIIQYSSGNGLKGQRIIGQA